MARKPKAVDNSCWNVTVIDKARMGLPRHIVETQMGISEEQRRNLVRKYYEAIKGRKYLMEFELVKD